MSINLIEQFIEKYDRELLPLNKNGYATMREMLNELLNSQLDTLKASIEGLKKKCIECGVITNTKEHLDYLSHTTREVAFNEALDEILKLLDKNQ